MESKKKILITSSLPYVNNIPHLGNIIGCVLSADVWARYKRLDPTLDVLFVCGTDEYGTATEMKAIEENKTCKEICDYYHLKHKEIYEWMNISFDVFGRTSDPAHTEITQQIFLDLWENNYISQKTIRQLYCEHCKIFLADRYIYGQCYLCESPNAKGDQCDQCQQLLDPLHIISPKCKVCSNIPVVKRSSHLFLDLYEAETILETYLKTTNSSSNVNSITKTWLREGLKSRCISRDLKWGVPIPTHPDHPDLAEYQSKVFYVWFDAPIGYISMVSSARPDWKDWWMNPEHVQLIQFMAKDNVPFHSILFPIILMGTNKPYTLFNKINATEYLLYQGQKFSKSNNVGIFGTDLLNSTILPDAWRAYLIWIRPEKTDSDFNLKYFESFYNFELIATIGNYINRIVNLTKKVSDSNIKFELDNPVYIDKVVQINELLKQYHEQMQSINLSNAFRTIFAIASVANKFLSQQEPWRMDKIPELTICVLFNLNIIRLFGCVLEPIIPNTTSKINSYLGIKPIYYNQFKSEFNQVPSNKLDILFPKITIKIQI